MRPVVRPRAGVAPGVGATPADGVACLSLCVWAGARRARCQRPLRVWADARRVLRQRLGCHPPRHRRRVPAWLPCRLLPSGGRAIAIGGGWGVARDWCLLQSLPRRSRPRRACKSTSSCDKERTLPHCPSHSSCRCGRPLRAQARGRWHSRSGSPLRSARTRSWNQVRPREEATARAAVAR